MPAAEPKVFLRQTGIPVPARRHGQSGLFGCKVKPIKRDTTLAR